jgi:hypothetical protein
MDTSFFQKIYETLLDEKKKSKDKEKLEKKQEKKLWKEVASQFFNKGIFWRTYKFNKDFAYHTLTGKIERDEGLYIEIFKPSQFLEYIKNREKEKSKHELDSKS